VIPVEMVPALAGQAGEQVVGLDGASPDFPALGPG
jgi:hypothetical protein